MLTQELKQEAAACGGNWGRQNAAYWAEEVEEGRAKEFPEWKNREWLGWLPNHEVAAYDRTDEQQEERDEYLAILDHAAKAAYEADRDQWESTYTCTVSGETYQVQITDIGCVVRFIITGSHITVENSGGCDVQAVLGGKLDTAKPETIDPDYIRELWCEGYDGDPDANGLRVTVEGGAK